METLCNCAQGYYGIGFCKPLADFIVLPAIITQSKGLKLNHPALSQGRFDSTEYAQVQGNETWAQGPSMRTFVLPLADGTNTSVQISTVDSIFDFAAASGSTLAPDRRLNVSLTLNELAFVHLDPVLLPKSKSYHARYAIVLINIHVMVGM
jgi:hypothetical protein